MLYQAKYHPQRLQSPYLPTFFYSVSLLTLRASLQHENSKDSTLAQNTSDICHNHVTGSSIQLDEEMKIPLTLTLPTPQLVSPRSVWSISLHGSHPPSISLCSHLLIPFFWAPAVLTHTVYRYLLLSLILFISLSLPLFFLIWAGFFFFFVLPAWLVPSHCSVNMAAV